MRRKHLFLILNGFLLATIFYFYSEDRYEKKLFTALANHITSNTPASKDSLIIKSLNLTHQLGEKRVTAFGDQDLNSFKSFIHPVTLDLMTARGSCGSYCMVLSRILTELNVNNRIVQMKVNGNYGGHIVVEVQTADNSWAVLDPSYDLLYKKQDGKLASFNEVGADWQYFSKQVTSNFNLH